MPRVRRDPVWLHAASMGEARGVVPVADVLAKARRHPVLATSMTPAGVASLRRALATVPSGFLPLDLPGLPEKGMARVRPRLLIVFETEIWPGLWTAAGNARVPVAVANARLSERSLRRYRAARALFEPLVAGAALVAAQSEEDAGRWLRLGARREAVAVTGSTKHDLVVDTVGGLRVRALVGERPLVVAGSTRPGEEAILVEACRGAALAGALVAVAPRHAARFEEAWQILAGSGLPAVRWSRARSDEIGPAVFLLVDTLGELNAFYAAADVALVGGSLLPFGGHNVFEAAAAGIPVLFGPFTEHVGASADRLAACGGGTRVADAAAVRDAVARLLSHPAERRERGAAAREAYRRESGATERLIAALGARGLA
jgi:3-deoxy-D-manno-octulosonic-acid transferase